MIPDWWEFVLLSFAAFRVWKLLADDVIFDGLRARFFDLYETKPERAHAVIGFISCGWCLGFWVGVLWWLGWLAWDTGALVFATPWAIATVVGLLVHATDEPEPE